MRILSAAQMRAADELTTERLGIPQLQLMENAAQAVLAVLAGRFGPLSDRVISVLCGRGNNGGDGLALARLLRDAGARTQIFLFARPEELRDLPRIQYKRLRRGPQTRIVEIRSTTDWDGLLPVLRRSHCAVDALLGTGVSKPLAGLLLHAAESLNALDLPVVSIDIPSGLFSDDIAVATPCVHADVTVTFTAPKIGMLLSPAAGAVGEMIVAPIGTPADLVELSGARLSLVTRSVLEPLLRSRPRFSHKGDFGKVLIVAGSRGKSGAAVLAGLAALRAGAGLVTLAVPSAIQITLMAAAPPELMTEGLASTPNGRLTAAAGSQILRLCESVDAVAIGPGLGTAAGTVSAVCQVVRKSPIPVVADADALNALALTGRPFKARSPLVLTPHLGEMGRLVGRTAEQVFVERLALAGRFARERNCVLVLKGYRTLISDPEGETWINSTGNPGMATAGCGDVLTGILAALLARRQRRPITSLSAAVAAAVYLHGAAGDAAASRLGEESMVAGDIIESLAEVFRIRNSELRIEN